MIPYPLFAREVGESAYLKIEYIYIYIFIVYIARAGVILLSYRCICCIDEVVREMLRNFLVLVVPGM
jgi:hypothetical protein